MNRLVQTFVRAMAFVVVLAVAAPASGLSQLLYFCTMTGEVGPKCSCMHEVKTIAPEGPALSAAGCCELVSSDAQLQPIWAELTAPELESPEPMGLPTSPVEPAVAQIPAELMWSNGPRGPPPWADPPLFIQHCAYLI
jgi:hypothetical protein